MLRAALQRPIAVAMAFAALLLVGGLSYSRLAVDLLPSIAYPRLTILTVYEDIPAEDLERLVTQRLEEGSMPNSTRLSSTWTCPCGWTDPPMTP